MHFININTLIIYNKTHNYTIRHTTISKNIHKHFTLAEQITLYALNLNEYNS